MKLPILFGALLLSSASPAFADDFLYLKCNEMRVLTSTFTHDDEQRASELVNEEELVSPIL